MTPHPEPLLDFRTIDLEKHRELACRFRRDSYAVSFGHSDAFDGPDGNGASEYLTWLEGRIQSFPAGQVHAWVGDEVVGQIEAIPRTRAGEEDGPFGYINLYYLSPKWRGQGLGRQLEIYVNKLFRGMGIECLILSVSPTNKPAWNFYLREGWKDSGPNPKSPEVHFMEKPLSQN